MHSKALQLTLQTGAVEFGRRSRGHLLHKDLPVEFLVTDTIGERENGTH